MKRMVWILCLAAALFSTTASGEFYRFMDKDGNVHFTDNLSLVPESQRKGLHPYTELRKKDETLPDEPVKSALSGPEPQKTPDLSPESASDEALDETKKRLDLTGQDLDLEHRDLIQERKALQEAQKKTSKNAIKALNDQILELNKKIEDFKIRQSAYNKKVEACNAMIRKRNAAAKEGDDMSASTRP